MNIVKTYTYGLTAVGYQVEKSPFVISNLTLTLLEPTVVKFFFIFKILMYPAVCELTTIVVA